MEEENINHASRTHGSSPNFLSGPALGFPGIITDGWKEAGGGNGAPLPPWLDWHVSVLVLEMLTRKMEAWMHNLL